MKRDTTIISLLLPLCLALSAADCGGDARADTSPPKPKAPSGFVVSAAVCSVASCRLIASWTPGPNWNAATDSVRVDWRFTSGAALPGMPHYTKGTADTVVVAQPAPGTAKVGTTQPCVFRRGISGGACNGLAPWRVDGEPIPPPDTLQGVQIIPASVTVAPGQTVQFTASAL